LAESDAERRKLLRLLGKQSFRGATFSPLVGARLPAVNFAVIFKLSFSG